MIDNTVHSVTPAAGAARISRFALAVGTAGSAIATALGLAWLVLPGHGFFYSGHDTALLAEAAGPAAAVVVQSVLGLVGIATGIAALAGVLPRGGIMIGSILQVVGFGIALETTGVLNVIGYLVALAMPVIAIILLVQLFRRYPRARWLVGVPLLIVLALIVFLAGRDIAGLAVLIGTALVPQLPAMLIMLLFPLIGFAWTVAAATSVAGTPGAERATAWVVRHRRVFTVIAACCLLPYTLARLTWFTPWPLLGGEGIDLQTQIWGALLGSAGWLGFALTLGLIRPWGEIFPRWMPGLAGRPVPIAVAAVPGGAVAAIVCAAAVPWLYAAGRNVPTAAGVQGGAPAPTGTADAVLHALTATVFFPCWLWGPTLALAVWGYVGHRHRAAEPAGR